MKGYVGKHDCTKNTYFACNGADKVCEFCSKCHNFIQELTTVQEVVKELNKLKNPHWGTK